MTGRRRRSGGATRREYPRTARVNQLVREIVAEELEAIDDERLGDVAITEISVDAALEHAAVYWDARRGPEADDEINDALREHRVRLQAAIGRQARMRRTPNLSFHADPAVRGGERIDAILRDMDLGEGEGGGEGEGDPGHDEG